MQQLVNGDGTVNYGLFQDPLDEINFQDYSLVTPSGRKLPDFLKRLRYKTFHFIGIASPGFLAGFAIVDLGYLASGFSYLYDREFRDLNEKSRLALATKQRISIRPTPESPFSRFATGSLLIQIDHQGVRVDAGDLVVDVKFAGKSDEQPLRLCTRTGYTGWAFTRKMSPLAVEGIIRSKGKTYALDTKDSFAITDWTGGFLRRETFWNWAAISTVLDDGRTLGANLSWGVNETGFTENAFWINGVLTKVDTVCFFRVAEPSKMGWRITSFDRKVILEFIPEGSRGERVNVGVIASAFTQYFGRFNGSLNTGQGEPIVIQDVPGWFEDHYAKW